MALAWGSLQEVFVMLFVVVFFFYLTGGFSFSLLFDVIRHPFVSYRWVYQPSSSQSNSRHFHFNLSGLFRHIFTASAMFLSRPFFIHGRFLPYTQIRAWTPHPGCSSVPALTELSLPADAWPWTIDVWIIRPLVYWLCQWATKYSQN